MKVGFHPISAGPAPGEIGRRPNLNMPPFIILLMLFIPRVGMATILVLWLLTNWFQGIFNSALWPVVGFFLLPLTTLWFSVVVKYLGGQWSVVPIIGVVISVLIDLSPAYRKRSLVLKPQPARQSCATE